MTERQPTASPTEQALEKYAHFLQRTKEMGVVGHRGGLKATGDLLQMCDRQPGQRILGVGCGSGYTACTTAKQHQASVVAVDLESHLLALARERARSMRVEESVALSRADARRLPSIGPYFPQMKIQFGILCKTCYGIARGLQGE